MNFDAAVKIFATIVLAAWWNMAALTVSAAEADVPLLKMTMDIQEQEDGPALIVSVKADRKMTVYKADLPWGNRNTLILLAVAVNPGRMELEQIFTPDNPGAAEITLEKDKEYFGKLPLNQHFKDLRKILGQRDVILFWSYEMSLEDGTVLPRQGGYLLMKRVR